LENISFKGNKIAKFGDIDTMMGMRFHALKELILDGNPLLKLEAKKAGGEINFKSKIKSLFPSLKLLDGEILMDEIEFGVKTVIELPVKTKAGFSDISDTLNTAHGFLQRFLDYFDNNRAALSPFYVSSSIFSLSIGEDIVNVKDSSFCGWTNRNLKKLKVADKRFKTLHVGGSDIVSSLIKLPSTKHPLNSPSEEKRFLIDAYQHAIGSQAFLYIYLHGDFTSIRILIKVTRHERASTGVLYLRQRRLNLPR
jgi:hypothetical protein